MRQRTQLSVTANGLQIKLSSLDNAKVPMLHLALAFMMEVLQDIALR